MTYTEVAKRLELGEVVLLDGATGTELQRRGVPMEPTAWCGAGTVEGRTILEAVHRDYIAAGAGVITANTFATSRMVLSRAGLGERFEEINRTAVDAALAAADGTGAIVAGSLSHMVPRRDLHVETSDTEIAESFAELAALLKEAGCALILLEMMFAPERMRFAFEAAAATGLPVWAGFSARRGAGGEVLSFLQGRDIPFAEIPAILKDFHVQAAGLMHSESEVTGDALALIREVFDGPLTAYPDSGHMKMPEWQFEEIISVPDFLAFAQGWREQGVQVFGGCCGLGVDHISALNQIH